MFKPVSLATVMLLTLGGCAQSPQQISLNPTVKTSSYLSNQPSVFLSIIDKRPSQSLGTRGGVYSGSNHITLAQDLPSMLKPSATTALSNMGIQVDEPSPMPTDLQIWVEKLQYDVKDNQTLPIEVTLHVQIAAIANKDNRQQVSRYESSKVHKFLTAPNAEKNEEIINEIFSTTLSRLLNDSKLIALIEK